MMLSDLDVLTSEILLMKCACDFKTAGTLGMQGKANVYGGIGMCSSFPSRFCWVQLAKLRLNTNSPTPAGTFSDSLNTAGPVARHGDARYGFRQAMVNPMAGCGSPNRQRRNSAQTTTESAFFASEVSCYGGCALEASACRFPLSPVFHTFAQLPPFMWK